MSPREDRQQSMLKIYTDHLLRHDGQYLQKHVITFAFSVPFSTRVWSPYLYHDPAKRNKVRQFDDPTSRGPLSKWSDKESLHKIGKGEAALSPRDVYWKSIECCEKLDLLVSYPNDWLFTYRNVFLLTLRLSFHWCHACNNWCLLDVN